MTADAPQMDAGGPYEYLIRCVAIVTLMHERGILDEIISEGRILEEEVDQRVALLRSRYPEFAGGARPKDKNNEDEGG